MLSSLKLSILLIAGKGESEYLEFDIIYCQTCKEVFENILSTFFSMLL